MFLTAVCSVRASGDVRPDYPAAGPTGGGTYMFNYYLPPAPSSTPWWPSWSPDGKSIAVAISGSIWKIDPDTGNAVELTYNRKYHSSPDWSPDGKWIVYTADDDGSSIQLELLNVATGESHALTQDNHLYLDPVFSPDGTRLAYVSTRPNGHFNIFVRPLRDGRWAGEELQVTRDNSFGRGRLYFGAYDMHTQPRWTPDGRELLLVSNRNVAAGSGDLWRVPVEPDGMARAQGLVKEETLYRTRPDISRDGRRVIFATSRGAADQFTHLYVVKSTGGEPWKLTFGDFDNFHPRFSPDGERIAYISNQGGLPQLYVLDMWGGARKKIELKERHWRRPMARVRVRVIDAATSKPTAARIYAPASDGKFYAPSDAYSRISATRMPSRLNEHFFHTEGEFTLDVPAGPIRIQAEKGFAYLPASLEVEARAGERTSAVLRLKRITDLAARGWFSGSTHAHMNYGGNLHNTPAHMLLMGRAEDLDVVTTLVASKDSRVLDQQHFVPGGGAHPAGTADRIFLVGEEFRPPFWGHTFFIGLRDHLISPFTSGYLGTALESLYPSNTDMFRKAIEQGAVTAYVHAFDGEKDPLEGSLGVAKAFPVDAALGTVHALEWSSSNRATLRVWHHALNNDLPLAAVGGEDANTSLHRHTVIGSVRTYARLGPKPSAAAWLNALRAGKTFVTTGPLVDFTVNDNGPGASLRVAPGARLAFQGNVWSRTPLNRIVIFHNGKAWKEIAVGSDPSHTSFQFTAETSASGWYSLVAEGPQQNLPVESSFPFAVSGAVRVYVNGGRIRNRESAQYFVRWIDKLRGMAEQWPAWGSDRDKTRLFAQMDEARRVYERLAAEAGTP